MNYHFVIYILLVLPLLFSCENLPNTELKNSLVPFLISDSLLTEMKYDSVIVFKEDLKHIPCRKTKHSSIKEKGYLNTCYRRIGEMKKTEFNELLSILNDTNTYGGIQQLCSNTEIAIAMFRNDTIRGYIDFKIECNHISPHPTIPGDFYRRINYLNNDETKDYNIGFSPRGRENILSILMKYIKQNQ